MTSTSPTSSIADKAAPSNALTELTSTTPIHFIGIGGVGMSGLAKLLLEAGFAVSGSDVGENAYTKGLVALGAKVYKGHAREQVPAKALVVVSSSIDATNPETAVALDQGLTILHRSAMLREILEGPLPGYQASIGITGAHGKTSITGMTGMALRAAGLDPGIIAGGKLPGLQTNAIRGEALKMAVAELDESDGTLLQYRPELSVIANVELDHADFYQGGLEAFIAVFRQYVQALKPGSKVIYNVDCPNTRQLAAHNPQGVEAILVSPKPEFNGSETQTTYHLDKLQPAAYGCYQGEVHKNGKLLGTLQMVVPGTHNIFNGLCAIAVGDQMGGAFPPMAEALKNFTGMGRRFEKVGHWNGALLVDDYAHHPSEVLATLKAAKESLTGTEGRLIAVFQPHRYTRLHTFWEEFSASFGQADELIVADVYSAHEQPIPGITSVELTQKILNQAEKPKRVRHIPSAANGDGFEPLRDYIQETARPGDLVISMGAGSITYLLRNWEPTVQQGKTAHV